jgi:hypothetical protein
MYAYLCSIHICTQLDVHVKMCIHVYVVTGLYVSLKQLFFRTYIKIHVYVNICIDIYVVYI